MITFDENMAKSWLKYSSINDGLACVTKVYSFCNWKFGDIECTFTGWNAKWKRLMMYIFESKIDFKPEINA